MRVVTHAVAAQLLRAGHAVTIRRRRVLFNLRPPSRICDDMLRLWLGWALVLVDDLPAVVLVRYTRSGRHIGANVPQPYPRDRLHHGWQLEEVPWERVLGLGQPRSGMLFPCDVQVSGHHTEIVHAGLGLWTIPPPSNH